MLLKLYVPQQIIKLWGQSPERAPIACSNSWPKLEPACDTRALDEGPHPGACAPPCSLPPEHHQTPRNLAPAPTGAREHTTAQPGARPGPYAAPSTLPHAHRSPSNANRALNLFSLRHTSGSHGSSAGPPTRCPMESPPHLRGFHHLSLAAVDAEYVVVPALAALPVLEHHDHLPS